MTFVEIEYLRGHTFTKYQQFDLSLGSMVFLRYRQVFQDNILIKDVVWKNQDPENQAMSIYMVWPISEHAPRSRRYAPVNLVDYIRDRNSESADPRSSNYDISTLWKLNITR